MLENLPRLCVHADGADNFGNLLAIAIGQCLACILNDDAAKARKLLTIIDDWRNISQAGL